MWRYRGGSEIYVTTHEDSWRDLSLCGLPREWSRCSGAATAAFRPAMTPQQSPRQCNTDKNSSSNSNGREFRDTIRRPSTGGSCQTWGIQLLGAACATPAAGGSSGIGPFGSSRAAAATISGTLVAAAAASGSIAQVTSRPPAAAESFSAAAGTAAARTTVGTPRGSMATLRGLMYTAVSRPSAFVRYEPGGDGFDTAWVNAPMFLISVAPPDAAAAAGAAAGGNYDDDKRQQQQQETGSRQEPPRPQQPQEQQPQLDMLISITQNSNLDVAPISMAVFKARVTYAAVNCGRSLRVQHTLHACCTKPRLSFGGSQNLGPEIWGFCRTTAAYGLIRTQSCWAYLKQY